MIIVRNSFVAKPGQASKLAAQLKAAAAEGKLTNARILTDLTGDFNRVIMEFEAASIGEFETRIKEYETNEAFREKMKGYTDLWVTGHREILRVW
jgi:multidrug efflux pump subunit AcrA (membrane-fusion protein)